MKHKFKHGEDFDISNVEVDEENTQEATAKIRPFLVYSMVSVGVVFLLGSALMGFSDGEFSGLQAIWNVLAVPFGAVTQYYFSNTK